MSFVEAIDFSLEPAGGPFDDPAVLVTPNNWRESILLDCGTLSNIKTRDLLRVKWLFLSHLHIDHLIGFDHLLRVRLFSPLPLLVFGPPETTRVISHRLQGYSWNLTSGSPFEVHVTDLDPGATQVTRFRCHHQFQAEPLDLENSLQNRRVELSPHTSVAWHPVKHGVPCLAYRLDQHRLPRFSLERAQSLGLQAGPWVRTLTEGLPLSLLVGEEQRDHKWLARELLETRAPNSLGYLTDTLLDGPTRQGLTEFFQGVDWLISEAAYLVEEEALARQNLHMTTHQTAGLAKECGAKALALFHLSRRHLESGPEKHLAQAREVFPETTLLGRP